VVTVLLELEEDGRWIVEVTEIPGVMAYGCTREDALRADETLALWVLETGRNLAP